MALEGPDPPRLADGSLDEGSLDDGSVDDLVAELSRWLADGRVDAAAASRARERWLRQAAEEEALFAGILLDLAERDMAVMAAVAGNRTHRGVVRAVAEDFCALRTADGGDVLLRYDGISSVRPHGRPEGHTGDRARALDMTFNEAVVALAGDRPRVLVITLDGTGLSGELRAAGRDVLTLRLDGEARATSYVPLGSVAELSIVSG